MVVDAAMEAEPPSPCASGTLIATLPFSMYPQLMQAGGSLQTKGGNGYQDPQCLASDIVVVTPVPRKYVALSGSCTFTCCVVQYDGTNLVCPCHDGVSYALDGTSNGTRPVPPLQVLTVCTDGNALYVSV